MMVSLKVTAMKKTLNILVGLWRNLKSLFPILREQSLLQASSAIASSYKVIVLDVIGFCTFSLISLLIMILSCYRLATVTNSNQTGLHQKALNIKYSVLIIPLLRVILIGSLSKNMVLDKKIGFTRFRSLG